MHRLTVTLIACLLLIAAGCGNLNRVPRYDVTSPEGEVKTFKRFAVYDEHEYLARWGSRAWEPRRGEVEGPLTDEQRTVIERHGQPDWVRFRFLSHSHELVDQWAWWDRNVTVQFVQGEPVWEGPLTDMDKYLIRHGYPEQARFDSLLTGVRRDNWIYYGNFRKEERAVSFTDEKLISEFQY